MRKLLIILVFFPVGLLSQEIFIVKSNGKIVSFTNKIVVQEKIINPQAKAIIEKSGTTPDILEQYFISDWIDSLQLNNIWDSVNSLLVFSVENEQLAVIDWKDTSRVVTPINTPTFTADSGYIAVIPAVFRQ